MPTLKDALKDKLIAGYAYLKNPNERTERARAEAIAESEKVSKILAHRWNVMKNWRYDTSTTPGINKWQLEPYAWPGGYPIAYLTRHNDVLCPTCANAAINDTDDMPPIAGFVIDDPDDETYCDECGKPINGEDEPDQTKETE